MAIVVYDQMTEFDKQFNEDLPTECFLCVKELKIPTENDKGFI